MEVMDAIKKRQSVRRFKEGDIPEEDLLEMLEAARLAPSGKNLQNWHYIVIKNRDVRNRIADAVRRKNEEICLRMDAIDKVKGDRFRKFAKNFTLFFTGAPVLMVVMTETYHPSGWHELEFIGSSEEILHGLDTKGSPGSQSLGASIENLYLRAIDMGYGMCWITSANYASEEVEKIVRDELGFEKEGYYMGCLIALGVPEDDPKSPPKKKLEDIYTFIE